MTRRASRHPSRRRRFRRRVFAALALITALGGGAFLWVRMRELARDKRLDALERTRDELRARLAALRAKDPVVASAPKGDVLIGVPEAVGSDLIRHAAAAFLSRVEIELHDLLVHKTGRVRVKTLVGRMTPGSYDLEVRIRSLRGTLKPGVPQVRYRGRRIDVEAPVHLTHGEGRADLRLRWDSRGIAGAFCPDFQARFQVRGTVVPRTYAVAGRLEGGVSEGTLTAVPSFPDLEVNLRVEPSAGVLASARPHAGPAGLPLPGRAQARGRSEPDSTCPREGLRRQDPAVDHQAPELPGRPAARADLGGASHPAVREAARPRGHAEAGLVQRGRGD